MSGPLIAVDMDDVLSETNRATMEWHNNAYGTSMSIEEFYYFHYWKNSCWGTPEETFAKLAKFYKSPRFKECNPVPFAREGLTALKSSGYRLIVITARSHEHSEISESWIESHLPGVFEEIIFTSTYAPSYTSEGKINRWAGKTKAEVIKTLGADLLIDDSLDNAVSCAQEGIPVLLFGSYEWNKRRSSMTSPLDQMSHAQRIAAGDHGYWEKDIVTELPSQIQRVTGWREVLDWLGREGHRVCRREVILDEEVEASEEVLVFD